MVMKLNDVYSRGHSLHTMRFKPIFKKERKDPVSTHTQEKVETSINSIISESLKSIVKTCSCISFLSHTFEKQSCDYFSLKKPVKTQHFGEHFNSLDRSPRVLTAHWSCRVDREGVGGVAGGSIDLISRCCVAYYMRT